MQTHSLPLRLYTQRQHVRFGADEAKAPQPEVKIESQPAAAQDSKPSPEKSPAKKPAVTFKSLIGKGQEWVASGRALFNTGVNRTTAAYNTVSTSVNQGLETAVKKLEKPAGVALNVTAATCNVLSLPIRGLGYLFLELPEQAGKQVREMRKPAYKASVERQLDRLTFSIARIEMKYEPRINQLNGRIDELKAAHEPGLNAKYAVVQDKKALVQTLTAQVDALKVDPQRVGDKVYQKREQIEAIQDGLKKREKLQQTGKLTQLEASLTDLLSDDRKAQLVSQSDAEAPEDLLGNLLRDQIASLRADITALQHQLDVESKAAKALQSQLDEARETHSRLNDSYGHEFGEYYAQLQPLTDERDRLSATLEEKVGPQRKRREALEKEYNALQAALKEATPVEAVAATQA